MTTIYVFKLRGIETRFVEELDDLQEHHIGAQLIAIKTGKDREACIAEHGLHLPIRFYSCTEAGYETQFSFDIEGFEEGDAEAVVNLFLGRDKRFTVVSEDTYEFDGTFEEGKFLLMNKGFRYLGPASDDFLA